MAGMHLRRWLRETPVFEQMKQDNAVSTGFVLREMLRDHAGAIVRSIGSTWMLTATILIVILMSPSLLQKTRGFAAKDLQVADLAATAALCFSTVLIGAATDRFGMRRVSGISLMVLVAATYALYSGGTQSLAGLLAVYVFAGIGAGGVVLCPIMMVRAFPAAMRFSGVSFAYNLAYAIFGGITPLLVSWLAHWDKIAPAHYVTLATMVGIWALWCGPTVKKAALEEREAIDCVSRSIDAAPVVGCVEALE